MVFIASNVAVGRVECKVGLLLHGVCACLFCVKLDRSGFLKNFEQFRASAGFSFEGLAFEAHLCSICAMPKTAILRARVDSRRKARVERILSQLGLTPTQAV